MVPKTWAPRRRGVTHTAVQGRADMRRIFSKRCAAVVTRSAVGAAGVRAVVWLGTKPAAGVVATLATRVNPCVDRRAGLDAEPIGSCVVTALTARGHCDVGVKTPRVPANVTALVARITVGCTRQASVGNVVGGLAVGRWVAARVTRRTLVGYRQLGVVPGAGLPA